MKEKFLTVRITSKLQEEFNDTCKRHDLNKSAVVNTLIRDFVSKKKEGNQNV